jgi:DNA repair protein RadA/Sms
MSKAETIFVCTECGAEHIRWEGKCSSCGAWHSLTEFKIPKEKRFHLDSKRSETSMSVPKPLSEISLEKFERISTGFGEFDRVLGGGLVPGSVVLVGGDPGIGKSTLLLQSCASMSWPVLYVSGEESAEQVRLRAERMPVSAGRVLFLSETDLDNILKAAEESNCKMLVVDSIQTVYSADFPSSAGSVVQVRECAMRLMTLAKTKKITVVLVGHVTKEGAVAGPKVLEHVVDVVLYLEGERYQSFRVLRGIKNRFGSALELGVFEMTGEGLKEVRNPSMFFLSERQGGAGSAITVIMNGTRPFLVEVQALCTPTTFGYPKRTASGFDLNRLNLLIAVLAKKAGINLATQDIFVNVVGGFKITEPAADLAVAAAIVSSIKNRALPQDAVCFGEIGLSGEVRSVQSSERRFAEAIKMGFVNILTSYNSKNYAGARLNPVKNVIELTKILES